MYLDNYYFKKGCDGMIMNNTFFRYITYSLAFFVVDGIINKNGNKNLNNKNTYINVRVLRGLWRLNIICQEESDYMYLY